MRKQQKIPSNRLTIWWSLRSSYTKNKIINLLLFFLAFVVIGGANYCIMFHIFVPTIFPLDFFVGLFLVSPIFFFRKTKFDTIYLPIVVAIITVFNTINAAFHCYLGTIFSIKDLQWALENAGQIVVHFDLVPWWIFILNICLAIFFIVIIILYNRFWYYKPTKGELSINNRRKVFLALSMMVSSIVCFEITLQSYCASQRKNNFKEIDYVNYSPNYYYKNLGMFSYYVQETRQFSLDKGMSVKKIKQYCNAATMPTGEYTGLLDKPNIIVIMLETGDKCIFDDSNPSITPNLFKFMHEGVYCNKNYAFDHTNVSDIVGMNGSFPEYMFHAWKKLNASFNLPNILSKQANYQSFYTHDIVSSNDSYHRIKQNPHAGFTDCWFHKDIIPTTHPWNFLSDNFTRDSIYTNGSAGTTNEGLINKIKSLDHTRPFYLHYMTVHMHMNSDLTKGNKAMYKELENEFGPKLQECGWKNPFNPNSSVGKKYRRFILKSMDFDKALGSFMNYLYNSDDPYLNNTLMCICADHAWYENATPNERFYSKLRYIHDDSNIKQYSALLGFYHPDLNNKFGQDYPDHKLNLPTWPTVVVPSILQLLKNVTYNPRLYLNKSIFDPSYDDHEIFYSFWTTKFMNEHYTSSDHHHISKKYLDDGSEEDFIEKLKDARFRHRLIDTIYKKNIFGKYNYEEFMPLN